MQIGAVMQVQVVSAGPDETAADAIRRMLDAGIGSVVVVEDTSLAILPVIFPVLGSNR